MRTRCAELFGLLPVEGLGERSELLEPLGLPVHGEAESAPSRENSISRSVRRSVAARSSTAVGGLRYAVPRRIDDVEEYICLFLVYGPA
jgi:hypothetical protein